MVYFLLSLFYYYNGLYCKAVLRADDSESVQLTLQTCVFYIAEEHLPYRRFATGVSNYSNNQRNKQETYGKLLKVLQNVLIGCMSITEHHKHFTTLQCCKGM